jgi:hypothetical protein
MRARRVGGARRKMVTIAAAVGIGVAALAVPALSAGAASTNGDPTTFYGVACVTIIPVTLDIESQMIVPNAVGQNDTYTATIPAGETVLPSANSGLEVQELKNLSQSYQFVASSGSAAVTNVSASSDSAGNDQAFRSATWSPGAPVFVNTIAHSTANGGTFTFTTTTAHGLSVGQAITTVNNAPAGYNFASRTVAAVTNSTTFTVTGVGTTAPAALATKGFVARTTGSTPSIVYVSAGTHDLNVGNAFKTKDFVPAGYNVNTPVTAVPNPTTLVVAARVDARLHGHRSYGVRLGGRQRPQADDHQRGLYAGAAVRGQQRGVVVDERRHDHVHDVGGAQLRRRQQRHERG